MTVNQEKIAKVKALLASAERDFAPAVLTTSFAFEGMVLVDIVAREHPGIEILTLDTGRLPPETYELMQKVNARYRRKVKVYYPETAAVERYVRLNGINGFYDSVAQRQDCCDVRKVQPLERALAGKKAWITGLRRAQSSTRQATAQSEYDRARGVQKFNPIVDWADDEIWAYLKAQDVPYNTLHDRGFLSIGCAPCTRAVEPGEHVRAGRWWWEADAPKECGMHFRKPDNAPQQVEYAQHAGKLQQTLRAVA
jgi:phosphoadenosine phosphosulfate reductase